MGIENHQNKSHILNVIILSLLFTDMAFVDMTFLILFYSYAQYANT